MGKRGQVTIFIIIGIAIVAIGILIYVFYPKLQSIVGTDSNNPTAFMQTCLEDEIEDTVEILSLQGGSMNPENYVLNDDNKIEYLCYTDEPLRPCVVQQPMLKSHIESEIESKISPIVDACLEDLKSSFEDKGYDVSLTDGNTTVELLPEAIVTTLTNELVLTKGDSEKYEKFRIIVNSKLYELTGIARSIIAWEAAYGDAETTTYMNYYHDLKVEKEGPREDGATIYILTNRDTKEVFQFASKSLPWPPGLGIGLNE